MDLDGKVEAIYTKQIINYVKASFSNENVDEIYPFR